MKVKGINFGIVLLVLSALPIHAEGSLDDLVQCWREAVQQVSGNTRDEILSKADEACRDQILLAAQQVGTQGVIERLLILHGTYTTSGR